MGKKDLIGQKFGSWTVLERAENDYHGNAMWRCQCGCGKEATVRGNSLQIGDSKSCGCIRNDRDIAGRKFGKLTAIERNAERSNNDPSGRVMWLCHCDCGRKTIVAGERLRNGYSKSCGCARVQKATKHGKYRTPEYRAWQRMKERCRSLSPNYYKDYRGRGIKICNRWLYSFEEFYEDMGGRPGKEYSIDRIDNDLHYSCGKCDECLQNGWIANCHWATALEQANNRRNSKQYKNQ